MRTARCRLSRCVGCWCLVFARTYFVSSRRLFLTRDACFRLAAQCRRLYCVHYLYTVLVWIPPRLLPILTATMMTIYIIIVAITIIATTVVTVVATVWSRNRVPYTNSVNSRTTMDGFNADPRAIPTACTTIIHAVAVTRGTDLFRAISTFHSSLSEGWAD